MAETDNLPRWGGRPGGFETWHLTLTEPVSGQGVWIRAGLVAPREGRRVGHWPRSPPSIRRNPERTFGIQERHPGDGFTLGGPDRYLRTGDVEIGPGFVRGTVGGGGRDARFDLTFPTGARRTSSLPAHGDEGSAGRGGADGAERARAGLGRGGDRRRGAGTWTACRARRHTPTGHGDRSGGPGPGAHRSRTRTRVVRGVHRPGAPGSVPHAVPHDGRPAPAGEVDAVHQAAAAARLLAGLLAHRRGRPALPSDGPGRGPGRRAGARTRLEDPDGTDRYTHHTAMASCRLALFERRPGGFDEVAVLESHGLAHAEWAGRTPAAAVERSRRAGGHRRVIAIVGARRGAAWPTPGTAGGSRSSRWSRPSSRRVRGLARAPVRRPPPPGDGRSGRSRSPCSPRRRSRWSSGVIDGWSGAEYRVYWLFGAILNVPYLADGRGVPADARRRAIAHALFALLLVGTAFAAWKVAARRSRRRRSARHCPWERTSSATRARRTASPSSTRSPRTSCCWAAWSGRHGGCAGGPSCGTSTGGADRHRGGGDHRRHRLGRRGGLRHRPALLGQPGGGRRRDVPGLPADGAAGDARRSERST